MHPFMLRTDPLPLLGRMDVPSYFLMEMVAFLVATSLVIREARRAGIRVIDGLDLALVCLIAGLAGARLGHVFFEAPWVDKPVEAATDWEHGWQHLLCRWAGDAPRHQIKQDWNLGRYYLLHPQAVLAVWNGGFVWYGGFLLALAAGWLFCRRRKLAFWPTADLAAPIVAVGLSLGRIGCLFAGCCYGALASGPLHSLGLVIPVDSAQPIWPTQLFEALAVAGIAWVLYRARRTRRFDGEIMLLLIALYALWRPFNEALRGDADRVSHLGLTTSQWISLGLLAAVGIVAPMLWKARQTPRAERSPSRTMAGASA